MIIYASTEAKSFFTELLIVTFIDRGCTVSACFELKRCEFSKFVVKE